MADNVDEANQLAELHLASELTKAKAILPPLTGRCFYCESPTAGSDINRWFLFDV